MRTGRFGAWGVSLVLAAGVAACGQGSTGDTQDAGARGDGQATDAARDGQGMDAANDAQGMDAASDAQATDAARDGASSDAGGGDGAVGSDAGEDAATRDAGPCGVCPSGFTCGASGYCVSAEGVPAFGHVYLVVMENHSLTSVLGSSDAPFLTGLANTWVHATAYVTRASSPIHPSCPNYIALTSGDTHGIDCDCAPASPSITSRLACITAHTSSSCPQDATHLGDSLDAAGVAWREYGEDMGTPCNTADSGNYVARHIPFLYYNNVRTDAARCALRVRDFGDFAGDLAAGTFRFSMISPNLCDDMHGNGLIGALDSCGGTSDTNNGDVWLSNLVPTLLARPGFQAGGADVLFIVWDEENGSTGSEPIPLIVVSPLVRRGSTTAMAYDHYSLLATIESGLGASRVGGAEALAAPAISDVWR